MGSKVFELYMRNQYLTECRTAAGDAPGFRAWLRQPVHMEELRKYYGPKDVDELYIEKVFSHWQDPFPNPTRTSDLFDGHPAPAAFRYRDGGAAKGDWKTVLFSYATLQQWQWSMDAKWQIHAEEEAAHRAENAALDVAIARAGGNMFAFAIDHADGREYSPLSNDQSDQPPQTAQ